MGHDGVIIDFHLLKSLSEAHIRNGLCELMKISIVEEPEVFELLEKHCQDLIKHRFGFGEGAPAELREIARTIARKGVFRMLQLECPNLLEHDQRRAIAYGHTWSPVYELTPKPHPLHHGHAIAVDMSFSATWAAKEGWISEELRDRVHGIFKRHLASDVEVVHSEILPFLEQCAAEGAKADFIFMDLDKPCYQPCYELIMKHELLAPGGVMLCDNVLYRGLVAQHQAGELPEVSEKTAKNAAALDDFLKVVRQDMDAGKVRTLMMPVRDGMLALTPVPQ